MTATVTEVKPGIYDGIPAEDYHRGPGISASGLKRLLPPYTPAHYRYGEFESTAALDFGKVAHRLILGEGDRFVVSPYDSFRSKEAREWKAEQEAAGVVVISEDDQARARAMVAALDRNPLAASLFSDGKPEQSLYWTDAETGVLCRARFDWLRNIDGTRRLLIPDYKTCRRADLKTFAKAAADYGYAISAAFYEDGAKALGLDPDPLFLLVAQEKTAPYLSTVTYLHKDDMKTARALIRKGLRLYAECLERDEWPGYPATAHALELPTYHRITTEEYLDDDH